MNRIYVMRLSVLAVLLVGFLLGMTLGVPAQTLSPLQCADPLVGTDAHGHTYPGATVPFGMVQLSPDTRTQGWDACSGYHYDDDVIQGFSHTHLTGTGCGDLGDILIMPTVGSMQLNPGSPGKGYSSRFSHATEKAIPGYYRVFLQTPGVIAELTATARCGLHRYTFPASTDSHIIIDLDHGISNNNTDGAVDVENDTTISGFRKTDGWASGRLVFFVAQISKPFTSFGLARDDTRLPDGARTATGKHLKAFVTFPTTSGEAVLVKVGISGTSVDGARINLQAEIPDFDFDGVRRRAEAQWSRLLGAVQIDTPNIHIRRTFYSNLYESLLAPTLFDDVDGSYMGMDRKVHVADGFDNYTEFSLWDIYRAECPLLTILQPKMTRNIAQSLIAEYRENGIHSTPIWPLWGDETYCMIGYHSAPVLVDAYFKGLLGGDAETAYQAMRDTAMQNRSGLDTYKKIGYVVSTSGGQATSKTLEYAFDDWCLARMAHALGHQADAQMFYRRAGSYRNIFDSRVQFMRGRLANGEWRPHFNSHTLVGDEYTEADAWQYAFAVQQDVSGLIRLYGGDAGFIKKLDALFTEDPSFYPYDQDLSGMIGQYSQGDEQCHHVAYLYDYAGAPWKTQQRVRQVMATLYGDTPSAQCGNIDCGQMTAWYIFSALGFYPVNPASGVYVFGSPAINRAVIHLNATQYGGRTFTIVAANNSARNIYIQSASLNGKPLDRCWITHAEITAGGTLRFIMGPRPSTTWASSLAARPPGEMPTGYQYARLPAPSLPPVWPRLSLPIRIACGTYNPVGSFIPDPLMDEGGTNSNTNAVNTKTPGAAPAGVYQNERYGEHLTYVFPVPRNRSYVVRLHFAEIFDSAARDRLENVSINGHRVLTNFDIYATAGGMNKAVVKKFEHITPEPPGTIKISIAAAPASPDQYAKINGIEVLPE